MIFDPFAPAEMGGESLFAHEEALSLLELTGRVRRTLEQSMPEPCWLVAELSEVRLGASGHCFLEFVQKDVEGGTLVAKARGTIWRKQYNYIFSRFLKATGRTLEPGIKVMVQVEVGFHELYGFSLSVFDIDPTYTLGEVARRRREIIRQLEEDGVMNLNKELPLPRMISNVAVISSPTAAGFGDFQAQLAQSGFGFHIKLFPALMQGEKVEESVIAAFDAIAAEARNWDVVVLIRGGGATADLQGFDSYLLAANVAQFPLPVLTGIGHERDDTIVDLVAHTRLKTPTAVAAFLVAKREDESAALEDLKLRLGRSLEQRLLQEHRHVEALCMALKLSATRAVAAHRQALLGVHLRSERAVTRLASKEREALWHLKMKIESRVRAVLKDKHHAFEAMPLKLQQSVEKILQQNRQRHLLLAQVLKLADPERILALGFSMTFKDGRIVKDAEALREGDEITTRLATGKITSTVKRNTKE